MERALSIAISGTPGTGKTSLADIFLNEQINVLSVKKLAEKHGYLGDLDSQDGAKEVDIHRLSEEWQHNGSSVIVVEGHLSHFLDVDAIILLRCKPDVLQKRLEARGYSENKINANVEWELISGIWSELLEFEIETPILELDTTEQDIEGTYREAIAWLNRDFTSEALAERAKKAIDWMKK
jgi:adenylate kinase